MLFRTTIIRKALSAYGLLLLMACLFSTCQSKSAVTEIVMLMGVDDTGTHHENIKAFNEAHRGEIKVILKQGSRSSNELYDQMVAELENEDPEIDVFSSDVVWTPALATNNYVEDLSTRFYNELKTEDFLGAALGSASYQFRIWGIPWYTDAGVLFYRKDLLAQYGYEKPPRTWNDLIAMSFEIMDKEEVQHGFVFQGADYEGGTANACEFIWNSGGNVLLGDLSISGKFDDLQLFPNIVTVNSIESIKGLDVIDDLLTAGVTPQEVGQFKEAETHEAFFNGDAVFMRAWPAALGILSSSTNSKVKADQIGVCPLPTTKEEYPSYSCLGGWNLMINANSSTAKKDASWKLIKYLSSSETQKSRALKGNFLPSRRSLYEDQQLLRDVPIMALFKTVIKNTHSRPVSPYYMEISPEISKTFNQIITNQANTDLAVGNLQDKLEGILEMHFE